MGSPNLQLLMGQQAGAVAPPGEVEFVDHPGGQSQQWTVPLGVKSVSIVLVGGGAGADGGNNGGGGGLTWINNVPVTPGTNLTVKNGKTGSRFGSGNPSGSDTNGQSSTVHDASGNLIAQAEGGKKAQSNNGGSGGNESYNIGSNYQSLTWGGGRGGHGAGGGSGKGGGGGAGGYSGNGGNGMPYSGGYQDNNSAGSGGGGAGGGGNMGGGVGILGEGSSGTTNGQGGSGGENGGNNTGGKYGGGGRADNTAGAVGAVRIIWPGSVRQFPSTRTADE